MHPPSKERLDALEDIAVAAYDFCDDRRFDEHLSDKDDFVRLAMAVHRLLEIDSPRVYGMVEE